jgi:hypothetical protein
MSDLGETRDRVLDDEVLMVRMPPGYFVIQNGLWYTAYGGEGAAIGPSVRLVAIVEASWWHYNRTGTPLNRKPARRASRLDYGQRPQSSTQSTQLPLGWTEEDFPTPEL